MADKPSRANHLLIAMVALQIVLVVMVGYLILNQGKEAVVTYSAPVSYPDEQQGEAPTVSILADYALDWGAVNTADWTVPVAIDVTLSEASSESAAFVQFSGQQVAMQREGMHCAGLLSLPLFAEAGNIEVVVQEGDSQKLEIIDRYGGWPSQLLDHIMLSLGTTDGRLEYNRIRERLECRGARLYASAESSAQTWPVSATIVAEANGQEMARYELTWEPGGESRMKEIFTDKFSRDVPLTPDEATLIMVTVRGQIVDNHGLVYECAPYTVFEQYTPGRAADRTVNQIDNPVRIIAPDGQVLYENG